MIIDERGFILIVPHQYLMRKIRTNCLSSGVFDEWGVNRPSCDKRIRCHYGICKEIARVFSNLNSNLCYANNILIITVLRVSMTTNVKYFILNLVAW